MGSIKELSDEELQYGIDRCKARLSGIMTRGIMSLKMIKEALAQYKMEQQRRRIFQINF